MSIVRGSILFVFALVVFLAWAGPAPAPAPGDDEHKMKKMCAGEELKFPMPDAGMKKEMEACHTADGECHVMCVAKVLGVIDDKGMVVQSEVMDKITAVAPPSKVADITKAVNMCIEQHGKLLDMKNCETYNDLVQCAANGIKPICDWKD